MYRYIQNQVFRQFLERFFVLSFACSQCLKIIQYVAFEFFNLAFSTNFCPIKTELSGNTVWPQTSGFQNLAKLTIFGIFNELLSTQNVNVARFARNVELDFFCDFQTLCCWTSHTPGTQSLSNKVSTHDRALNQWWFQSCFCNHYL